jgi:GcrA cell cycle regulator
VLAQQRFWDQAMIDYLRNAISEGKSGGAIAKEMSGKFSKPVTRNSIIGKAHRLGLHLNGAVVNLTPQKKKAKKPVKKAVEKKPEPPKKAAKKPEPTPAPKPEPIFKFLNPAAKSVKLLRLREGMCRYPMGDPLDGTLRFCAAPADSRKSSTYCSYCYRLCYVPVRS